jgi:hypothetical protein
VNQVLTVRDLVACAILGVAAGVAWLMVDRMVQAAKRLPPVPMPDPVGQDVWRVLEEARRITIEGAREAGY